MSSPDPQIELAETFAGVARVLMAESDLEPTLDLICKAAVGTLDACEYAGISVIHGERVGSRVATDRVAQQVDEIQSETQQGPCVDAILEHEVFVTGALSTEERWPDFAHRAHAETGVESILAFRLYTGEDTMGALNLYSTRADAFHQHDVAVGAIFATHASVAFERAQHSGRLEAKAASRDAIGIAKGLLMAREGITDAEAFDMLRHASQRMNVKLRDIAQHVADSQPTDTR